MGRKKKYKGVANRDFGFRGVKYLKGNLFGTTNKEFYDHLINIKYIKENVSIN